VAAGTATKAEIETLIITQFFMPMPSPALQAAQTRALDALEGSDLR
jgi:hypothetical protein